VGAERKGPLAAFIVVAIIAVILLVTSVRSQAAPGWLDRRLPASVVAVVPSSDSGLWGASGNGMERIAAHGVVLVHDAPSEQATHDDVVTASVSEGVVRPMRHGSSPQPGPATQAARGPHRDRPPGSDPGDRAGTDAVPLTSTAGHHGRHLGWGHGHEHGHGPGHGHAVGHAHAHGHAGQPPEHSHGRHLGWARQASDRRV